MPQMPSNTLDKCPNCKRNGITVTGDVIYCRYCWHQFELYKGMIPAPYRNPTHQENKIIRKMPKWRKPE